MHQSHNDTRTALNQSHNTTRTARDQGATPGDEAARVVSPRWLQFSRPRSRGSLALLSLRKKYSTIHSVLIHSINIVIHWLRLNAKSNQMRLEWCSNNYFQALLSTFWYTNPETRILYLQTTKCNIVTFQMCKQSLYSIKYFRLT